jgi:hypothetical protein
LRQEEVVDLSSQLAPCFGILRSEFVFADADIHHLLLSGRNRPLSEQRIRREQHLKLGYPLPAYFTTLLCVDFQASPAQGRSATKTRQSQVWNIPENRKAPPLMRGAFNLRMMV